ncbi:MAG TPA: YciI family protein [Trebonia sp.]|nr:YciI family protein [Trebonia sp.]
MDLEAFELVLLRRPASAPDYPDEELERIQREHLAYHARLRESGDVVTNGPVDGQPDPSLRGLTFYRTGSVERARELAEADPAVLAGRLAVDIMTWYCPPGTMGRPGKAVTLP